jgi:hypothetical protein
MKFPIMALSLLAMARVCTLGVRECGWTLHTLFSMLYVCRDWRRACVRAGVIAALSDDIVTPDALRAAPDCYVKGSWKGVLRVLHDYSDRVCALGGSSALCLAYAGTLPEAAYIGTDPTSPTAPPRYALMISTAQDADLVIRGRHYVTRDSDTGEMSDSVTMVSTLTKYLSDFHHEHLERGEPYVLTTNALVTAAVMRYPSCDMITYATHPGKPRLAPHEYVRASFDLGARAALRAARTLPN